MDDRYVRRSLRCSDSSNGCESAFQEEDIAMAALLLMDDDDECNNK